MTTARRRLSTSDRGARLALALALMAPFVASALPLGQALHRPVPIEGRDALPPALQDVEVVEKLGAQVPLERAFTDQAGRTVKLRELLGQGRPVVLSLVYYDCPMLCGLVLTGAARGMRESGLVLGKDFDAVTLSFDPRDTTARASERQRGYLQALGSPEAKAHWTFLTSTAADAKAVADAVGFKYAYDPRTRQFAHPAAIFVLTPEGRVSRYLYGVDFPGKDVRLAIVEASQGRVGTSFDRLLLTCYKYDPASRKYEPYVLGFVRISMLAVLGGLALMLGVFWRRELKRKPGGGPGPSAPAPGGRASGQARPAARRAPPAEVGEGSRTPASADDTRSRQR